MKFKPGDKVICTYGSFLSYNMRKGNIYTVISVGKLHAGEEEEYMYLENSINEANGKYWKWPCGYFEFAPINFNEAISDNDKNKLFRYLKDYINA